MVHTHKFVIIFKSSITIPLITLNVYLGKDNNKEILRLVYTSM